jgi:UDP-N-acetylmuramoyl-L-alanyl-D-glutamate--2,6-diaminopimelate ligase
MSVPAERLSDVMTLQSLLHGMVDAPAIEIAGITTDSRLLRPGEVFLACAGVDRHGLKFAKDVTAAGAVAIVYDTNTSGDVEMGLSIPTIAFPGLHSNIGEIANRWYNSPSESLRVTAVTGTNGKTTVAVLLSRCLQILGRRCGYIGTLGQGIEKIQSSGGLTSPACIELHESLAEFRDDNATDAAIEVSSHALTQGRTDGVRFNTAIFTNLSRDHLDYHGDMQNYFDAKAQLFTDNDLDHRIINIDGEFGLKLADRCESNVVVVSTQFERISNGRPFVFARGVVADESGSQIKFNTSWGDVEVSIRMPGDFNVENTALVLASLLRHGVSLSEAGDALAQVDAPPGRMQAVKASSAKKLPSVFVDFAHTPSALEKALKAIRQHSKNELWCVFGCGGDRDRGKRPQMGEVAARLADYAIVTTDNPRSEDASKIIGDILAGMNDQAIVIEDRAAAIAYAIDASCDSATVMIAGRGHESMQLVGEELIPFSDFEVALANLEARGKKSSGS